MSDQEKQIEELEEQFASDSGSAFARARERALASGMGVVEAHEGELYEVFGDGTRKFLKKLESPREVRKGKKLLIK